jgi:hypothetical protein
VRDVHVVVRVADGVQLVERVLDALLVERRGGSMMLTIRRLLYDGLPSIDAMGSMYCDSYSVSPAAVAGISPLEASAAQSRPGRS